MRAFAFDDISIRADGDGRTVGRTVPRSTSMQRSETKTGTTSRTWRAAPLPRPSKRTWAGSVCSITTLNPLWHPGWRSVGPYRRTSRSEGDDRGVFTVTRYLDNPLADSVLDAIKQRAIKGQSFSGRFVKSQRTPGKEARRPDADHSHRGCDAQYGPTVFPRLRRAAILGTRNISTFLDALGACQEDQGACAKCLGSPLHWSRRDQLSASPEAAPVEETDPSRSLRSAGRQPVRVGDCQH